MNPGFRISGFIESYTGITNAMLRNAPPCGEVMARFADFIDGDNLVAHNASFDRRFLDAELAKIGKGCSGSIACSMLTARRILQDAPNHKLETLVRFLPIETDGTFHRALADSEMTAWLWLAMVDRIRDRYAIPEPTFSLMRTISRTCKAGVNRFLENSRKEGIGESSSPLLGCTGNYKLATDPHRPTWTTTTDFWVTCPNKRLCASVCVCGQL
jgi:DNA polymerase-3 subunit epsilon